MKMASPLASSANVIRPQPTGAFGLDQVPGVGHRGGGLRPASPAQALGRGGAGEGAGCGGSAPLAIEVL
jgi:hypothetical protein